MAVLVEALSVILRRDAIARRYNGGWHGFVAKKVNSTLCADSEIARVGFMHPNDVSAFIEEMESSGFVFLDQTDAAVDMVVVDQREGPTTSCQWIEFFRQDVPGGTVSAVRLKGSQDNSLICPDGWDFEHSLSNKFEFIPRNELGQDYVFLRHEFGTDVFLDLRTGQEVYLTRPTSLNVDAEDTIPDMKEFIEEHNLLLAEAGELLGPFLQPNAELATVADVKKVSQARDALERVTSLRKNNWNAWFGLGIARRLLHDREGAYAAFARAYGLNSGEIEIGRNLAAECIELGYGQEAINIAAALVTLSPDDAGLVANHALALLIGGDVSGAMHEINRALELDPTDEIAMNLRRFIDEVRSGRVQAPTRLSTS